jgi:hypothetical protein
LIRKIWHCFPKEDSTRNKGISDWGNDVESEQEKAFSNKKIAKAKELYLHLI